MTTLTHQVTGQCECSVDPTVDIKDTLLHPITNITVNVVTKELVESLEEAGDAEDDKCVVVVKSEGCVVYQTFLNFESWGEFP